MNTKSGHAWAKPWAEVLTELSVPQETGLNESQIRERHAFFGYNRLEEVKPKSHWVILFNQIQSLIVLLLGAAAVVSFAFGEWMEGSAIVIVILINTIIGFVTELRAVRSMEALRRLGRVSTRVRREGQIREVPAEEIVPGDILILEGGDVVTADIRLFKVSKLKADESALTGESFPVEKHTDPVSQDIILAEKQNMLFKGTSVVQGSGEGVAVETGMSTELGRISALVAEAEEEVTPLEKSLNRLGHRLIWVTLLIAAFVAVGGILSKKELFLMIESAIALAVAAIPEGLPIVATISLAKGVWRMARRNALVNRLSAVETLGATDIICTDKTGTLTENLMSAQAMALDSGEIEIDCGRWDKEAVFARQCEAFDPTQDRIVHEVLKVGMLCNNASFEEKEGRIKIIGDPLEAALLIVATRAGLNRDELVSVMPELREEAFDSVVKMMATFNRDNEGLFVSVKGAAESVVAASTHVFTDRGIEKLSPTDAKRWEERNNQMAKDGLRVLAFAEKNAASLEEDPYENLTFLGLIGFLDPPREDVLPSIQLCKQAGIRVIMVTGDQPITARLIASAVGLVDPEDGEVIHGSGLHDPEEMSLTEKLRILEAPIFARVTPKQKLDLIKAHQMNGSVVAMTGDGVNDAPALKKADIGIAMGRRGTQVAQEAADMVLKDDAFSTIVYAVSQGRVIFQNIRRCVRFLLSCNISEILAVGLAAFINAPLPILPLQILFLNLITDVFPALALGVGEGDEGIMKLPPRDPKKPILTRSDWLNVAGYGFLITLSVLASLAAAISWLNMEVEQAVSVSFLTLAFSQLWHVFNMRDRRSGILRNDIVRNPLIWGALLLCVGLLLAAVYVPGLNAVLKVVDPGRKGWLLITVMSLVPLLWGQLFKIIRR